MRLFPFFNIYGMLFITVKNAGKIIFKKIKMENNKSKKILVAEDEKAIAKALTLKLQHVGYEVTTVFDGKSAISALEKEVFDLALMDLVMPVMDGFGALEEIKKKNIKTPVIILSNLSQEEDLQKVKALGAKDYFIKSNTPLSEIVKRVETFFASN